MSIQILLYDDNQALLTSLQTLLTEEADFVIAAMFSNAETVEADIRELNPDVVVMDIDMPQVNGVEAVRRIRKVNRNLPVIMLTVFDDNENIFNALCAGASGYLLKQHVSAEIAPAIRNAMSGGAPMTGSVAKKVLQMIPAARNAESEKVNLTTREIQILQLLVNGYSYKMIAAEIMIGLDGVRFHIKKIYDKLHVHSATEAVSKAIKDRLV